MKKKKLLPLLVFSLFAGGIVMTSCSNPGHVIVQNKEITNVTFTGNDTPIELGKFFERGIKIVLWYSDGTNEEFPITSGMFTEEELAILGTLGTHTVTISFNGNTYTFTVRIVEEKDRVYTVNFYTLDTSGVFTVLSSQEVNEGNAATAPSITEDIHNEADGHDYRFVEWDQEFDVVMGDMDIYPVLDRINYATVKFMNGANEVISTQLIDWGEDAVEPAADEYAMTGYRFIGWNRSYTNIPEVEEIAVKGIYVSDVTSYAEHSILTYGYYPQTRVVSSVLTSVLDGLTPNAKGYVTYCGTEYFERNDIFYKVEPVKWIVLNQTGDYKLVIAKEGIDLIMDHGDNRKETSEWVNEAVYSQLFLDHNTLEESDVNHPNNLIATTTVVTSDSDDAGYEVSSPVNINAKLFLPDSEELSFFNASVEIATKPTDYARNWDDSGFALRKHSRSYCHYSNGQIAIMGGYYTDIAVRPCMNIKL